MDILDTIPPEELARRREIASSWRERITKAEGRFQSWHERVARIEKRYRDERPEDRRSSRKMNLLWSNIETMKPALYSQEPKIAVGRRTKGTDATSRKAALIAEQCVTVNMQMANFDRAVRLMRDDYLMAGRGTIWLRYGRTCGAEETIQHQVQMADDGMAFGPQGPVAPDALQYGDDGLPFMAETFRPVEAEKVCVDYVHWRDFLHGPGGVWEEVDWVARRVMMTKRQAREKFDGMADLLKFSEETKTTRGDADDSRSRKPNTVTVWEVWSKSDGEVYWVSPECEYALQVLPDPLRVQGFFPCPRPAYATLTNGSLVPVPDYALYQDQAEEIDDLTGRMANLIDAIKVSGAYNAAHPELGRVIDSHENQLVPVQDWASFAGNGGIDGAITFFPVEKLAQVLAQVGQARASAKQDLYEVSGLSDIIRGSSVASETATAQRLKGQFATLRLQDRQREIQRAIRDALAMMAEIIVEHFDPQTIVEMAAVDPAEPDNVAAIKILKNDRMRTFRLDIETDSTLLPDEEADKAARIEFLQAVTPFLQQAMQVVAQQPRMVTLMGELLLFGVRGFRAGRELETAFETFISQAQQEVAAQEQKQARGAMMPPGGVPSAPPNGLPVL